MYHDPWVLPPFKSAPDEVIKVQFTKLFRKVSSAALSLEIFLPISPNATNLEVIDYCYTNAAEITSK